MTGDGKGPAFGEPDVACVRLYRKAATAVISSYLGLDDAFVDAALRDETAAYFDRTDDQRERLKAEHYDRYLSLIAAEAIVRYAAAAAESLAREPERSLSKEMVDCCGGGAFGYGDDMNAMVRVHEIFEYVECPDASDEAESILLATKRLLCDYYGACARSLVKEQLLPVIVAAAESLCRDPRSLDAVRVRSLIIAGQERRLV